MLSGAKTSNVKYYRIEGVYRAYDGGHVTEN
jgi:hypothetical protein